MTNFEKIKQMSVEEMAKCFYSHSTNCNSCFLFNFCVENDGLGCIEVFEKWLESEVSE